MSNTVLCVHAHTMHTHGLKSFHLITCVTRFLSIHLNLSRFWLCVYTRGRTLGEACDKTFDTWYVFKDTHKILIQPRVTEIKTELGIWFNGRVLLRTYEALSLSPGLGHRLGKKL